LEPCEVLCSHSGAVEDSVFWDVMPCRLTPRAVSRSAETSAADLLKQCGLHAYFCAVAVFVRVLTHPCVRACVLSAHVQRGGGVGCG
jgi:hypothetical protein